MKETSPFEFKVHLFPPSKEDVDSGDQMRTEKTIMMDYLTTEFGAIEIECTVLKKNPLK